MRKLVLFYLLLFMPTLSVYPMFRKTAVSLIKTSKKQDLVADLLKKLMQQKQEHNDMVIDFLKKFMEQKKQDDQRIVERLMGVSWNVFSIWFFLVLKSCEAIYLKHNIKA